MLIAIGRWRTKKPASANLDGVAEDGLVKEMHGAEN
jgi:hypothetical protein